MDRAQIVLEKEVFDAMRARWVDRHPSVIEVRDNVAEARRKLDSLKPANPTDPKTFVRELQAAQKIVDDEQKEMARAVEQAERIFDEHFASRPF